MNPLFNTDESEAAVRNDGWEVCSADTLQRSYEEPADREDVS